MQASGITFRRDHAWFLVGAALVYVALSLIGDRAALAQSAGTIGLLLLPALTAAVIAGNVADGAAPLRLSSAFVLAALVLLPGASALAIALAAAYAGHGGGVFGPRVRGLSGLATTAVSVGFVQGFAASMSVPPNLIGISLPIRLALLFILLQALALGMTLILGDGDAGSPLRPVGATLRHMLIESANVPLAWLVIVTLVEAAWPPYAALCLLALLAQVAVLRLDRTTRDLRRSHRELASRVEELGTLNAIGREIVSDIEPRRVFATLERECRKIFELDFFLVGLVEPQMGRLRSVYRRRRSNAATTEPQDLEPKILRWLLEEPRAHRIDDLEHLPPGVAPRGAWIDGFSRSALLVPLTIDGKSIGLLTIQSRRDRAFDHHQLSVLSTIARQAAVAIQNARNYELATRDSLTGFFVRDHFFSRVEEERDRIGRYGGSFGLLMVDLDGFKSINDRFGHFAGDCYLRSITDTIRNELRSADIACRYGGDEFCILLPETDLAGSQVIAERIRAAVAAKSIFVEGMELRTTVSIGIAVLPDHEAQDGGELMRYADQALYQAKRAGRDRVVPFAA